MRGGSDLNVPELFAAVRAAEDENPAVLMKIVMIKIVMKKMLARVIVLTIMLRIMLVVAKKLPANFLEVMAMEVRL